MVLPLSSKMVWTSSQNWFWPEWPCFWIRAIQFSCLGWPKHRNTGQSQFFLAGQNGKMKRDLSCKGRSRGRADRSRVPPPTSSPTLETFCKKNTKKNINCLLEHRFCFLSICTVDLCSTFPKFFDSSLMLIEVMISDVKFWH